MLVHGNRGFRNPEAASVGRHIHRRNGERNVELDIWRASQGSLRTPAIGVKADITFTSHHVAGDPKLPGANAHGSDS
jgi:hypothetical protein